MIYTVYFSDDGAPKTGLSPTLDIYIKVSDGTSGGTPPAVSELSGGFYKFTATPAEAILCRVDSEDGTMSDADRYKVLQITANDDDLDAAISTVSTHDAAAVVTALMAKTGITAVGSASYEDILKALYSAARGRIVESGNDYLFYDDDDLTLLFTLTISSTARTVA